MLSCCLLYRPWMILGKSGYGVARSSLFLSTYCASAWMWTCILFRIFRRCSVPMVAVGTFPTGLALAIEKKSRRIEISLYCLARAIESFFTCMADIGYLPQSLMSIKRADVVIFSLSTSIIMHCYAQEREVFRSKYLNVLDWVFGVPPPPCYTPQYKHNVKEYI
uniref:Transmembrane protein 135 N-terminal domain-containing protein n=1 Tax=Opuntia streptacantha TaxID=393608 RepID=A0A7C9DAM0_OPUST